MSTPTLRILAFSPPAVNGQVVDVVLTTAACSIAIEGLIPLVRELCLDVLIATGGIPLVKGPRKPGSGLHHAIRGYKLALYERVIARFEKGEGWLGAAAAEGVNCSAVQKWYYEREKRRAKKKA